MNRPWKIWKGILGGIAIVLIINGCFKEQTIPDENDPGEQSRYLRFNQNEGIVDSVDQIILFTLCTDTLKSFAPHVNFNYYTSVRFEGRMLINDQVNELGEVRVNHPYQIIIS